MNDVTNYSSGDLFQCPMSNDVFLVLEVLITPRQITPSIQAYFAELGFSEATPSVQQWLESDYGILLLWGAAGLSHIIPKMYQ